MRLLSQIPHLYILLPIKHLCMSNRHLRLNWFNCTPPATQNLPIGILVDSNFIPPAALAPNLGATVDSSCSLTPYIQAIRKFH